MIRFLLAVIFFTISSPLFADILEGNKKVYLVSSANELTHIANVTFTTSDEKEKVDYRLSIIDLPFENQFLSMRPFQCMMGKKQVMCHVPYPYEKSGFVTKSDITALSYDILFLHKNPAEYGINLWNGIFYKLELKEESIEGTLYEVDMNTIASPPEVEGLPFTEDLVFEADLDNYVYPRILIK